MTPLDQKTELHYRQCAMNMALSTHESQPNRKAAETLTTADAYYQFLTGNQMSADAPDAPQMVVHFMQPSGMPDDWTGAAPLPPNAASNVVMSDMSVSELQEVRRRQLTELDIVANAIKVKGAVPC